MKFKFLTILPIILVFALSINLFFGEGKGSSFSYYAQNIVSSWFPSYDSENKLKFVTNQTEVQVVANEEKFIMPVEMLDSYESNGYIYIKTHEKSVVLCPTDGVVKLEAEKNCVKIIKKNLTIELYEFEIVGVSDNHKIKCGQPIGSLKSDKLRAKIYLGKREISLSELRAFL